MIIIVIDRSILDLQKKFRSLYRVKTLTLVLSILEGYTRIIYLKGLTVCAIFCRRANASVPQL
jgi:hypothetical protein